MSIREMAALEYRDHRADPQAWADELRIPREAVELYLSSEVIDLHEVSFLWTRLLPGYALARRHRPRMPQAAFLNQADLPRIREAQLAGVCFDIPTNPFRRKHRRPHATQRNVRTIRETLRRFPDDFAVARNSSDYREARARGVAAGFIALQGGDAVGDSLENIDQLAEFVHRITLVELTESEIGVPSLKRRKARSGLTAWGRDFVRRAQVNGILVDLAHINQRGFFDVLEVADPSIPVVVTHTGVAAVRPLWRNIRDDQIKAIAERRGTIGIVFHRRYLEAGRRCRLESVVDHLEHLVDVVGDDHASIGSDFDGMIRLPTGLDDITHLPKLVAVMLERGWSDQRIRKIMGTNFLRVLAEVRP